MGKVLDVQTVKNMKEPGRYTDALVRGLHLWVKSGGQIHKEVPSRPQPYPSTGKVQ